MAGVDGQLLEDFDEYEAEDELDGQVAALHDVLLLGALKHLRRVAALRVALLFVLAVRHPLDALALEPGEQRPQQRRQAMLGHRAERAQQLIELWVLTTLQRL